MTTRQSVAVRRSWAANWQLSNQVVGLPILHEIPLSAHFSARLAEDLGYSGIRDFRLLFGLGWPPFFFGIFSSWNSSSWLTGDVVNSHFHWGLSAPGKSF